LKIGFFFEGELTHGGGFQQQLSTILLINKYVNNRFKILVITDKKENIPILKKYDLLVVLYKPRFNPFIEELLWSNRLLFYVLNKIGIFKVTQIDRFCLNHNIDLIFFLSTSSYSLLIRKTSYIITVWDLCHRDFPDFPEIKENNKFIYREYLLNNSLTRASAIIVDSELGKINLCNRYGVDFQKIFIIPFQPSSQAIINNTQYASKFIDIKQKYSINGDYIFYPAQFWPHKNHIYILKGLKILKDKYNKKIFAIFSGSDKGNLNFILKSIYKLGLEDQIKYIGFVNGNELPFLYKQALALVMPTYFGPTNIPPLEAFANNCPVLYSDLPGMREQTEGASWFINLLNPNSMVDCLLQIIDGGEIVETKKKKGFEILDKLSDKNIWTIYNNIFIEVEAKLSTLKQINN